MKKLLLGFLLLATLLSATNKTDQFNLSYWLYKPVSVAGVVTTNGLTPLTSDWNVGAFDLTAVDMTATNFKLLGTGTLTSALGNVSLTTSLTAASGDEVGFLMSPTINKAAGNYTAFKINATETGAPGTTDYLIDVGTGGGSYTSKFKVDNSGTVTGANFLCPAGSVTVPMLASSTNPDTGFFIFNDVGPALVIDGTRKFSIAASSAAFLVPTISLNGAGVYLVAGTAELQMGEDAAAPTDQTIKAADGLGADKPGAMLTLQGGQSTGTGLGGGVRIQTSTTSTTSSTANTEYTRYRAIAKSITLTDASATDVISFAVTAGNVVGGMLVYTIDVTDNDASDRQVESGTVQFCGLQDEANWHTNISEVSTQALESGALATTWAIDTATANTLKITCLADSDLTTPVIKLRYQLFLNSPIVETP